MADASSSNDEEAVTVFKRPEKRRLTSPEDGIPEKLKIYVSRDIWNGWSPIRRESFAQIANNPNAFFYRNRPPGDPQKFGPFTKEEETQFLERLAFFRNELGVAAGLWGLFAVPIRGRLGYQCSNFYRLLVNEGRVKDRNYEILGDGKLQYKHGHRMNDAAVTQLLEREAFEFIGKCMASENGEVPKVTGPIRVEGDRPNRPVRPKPVYVRQTEDFAYLSGRKRKLPERRFDPMREIERTAGGKGGGIKPPRRVRDFIVPREDDRDRCPICGLTDPLSLEPIETPMMDEEGFVMDLRSWRKIFKDEEVPPCETCAESEADLVELTPMNFHRLKFYVANFAV
jgi:hypothetical protein